MHAPDHCAGPLCPTTVYADGPVPLDHTVPATGHWRSERMAVGATGPAAHPAVLGVRRDPDRLPPSWPLPEGSQQAHLRIPVRPEHLDETEREAAALDARPVAAEDERR
ncbi:hypothetical protein [Streptomyces lavendulae]|uniref:hypothetical protein n=1 Tax=Streptomyces lavendulae TaxID=1914 RepID=UPI0024A3CA37|nr:hypothetical protein [Streptomyces lavendulae]GLW03880.1 hypothetical protein Slala05_75100 [Streptomyces lavendulae subsp. lavendulae]